MSQILVAGKDRCVGGIHGMRPSGVGLHLRALECHRLAAIIASPTWSFSAASLFSTAMISPCGDVVIDHRLLNRPQCLAFLADHTARHSDRGGVDRDVDRPAHGEIGP